MLLDSNRSLLNSFFSRNTLQYLIGKEPNHNFDISITEYMTHEDLSYVDVTKKVYDTLRKEYRNEYFYKNTLLNKLLLGVHSMKTTVAFTELPIAKSKADFVLINGKAVVYEIKTELDNLERLESQINDYYKAFDHVCVVTYEDNVEAIKKKVKALDKPIGIYVLRKRETLTCIQKPERYADMLDKTTIFKLLRKYEFESVLMEYFGQLPRVNAFEYYAACRREFSEIPLDILYGKVLKLLKNRIKINQERFDKVPYELKFLAYFTKMKQEDYDKLLNTLYKPYGGE